MVGKTSAYCMVVNGPEFGRGGGTRLILLLWAMLQRSFCLEALQTIVHGNELVMVLARAHGCPGHGRAHCATGAACSSYVYAKGPSLQHGFSGCTDCRPSDLGMFSCKRCVTKRRNETREGSMHTDRRNKSNSPEQRASLPAQTSTMPSWKSFCLLETEGDCHAEVRMLRGAAADDVRCCPQCPPALKHRLH
jgi:hypothetical protein